MREVEITLKYVRHATSDLIIAMSDELKGLYVHGRSLPEIEGRVETAIRAILEAEGNRVIEITRINDAAAPESSGFMPAYAVYQAELEAA